ncbi:MAG: hypothetical protein AB7F59_10750 [Bdellovibrionales bacterium]
MRSAFIFSAFILLFAACHGTYKVKRDLEIKQSLNRTCVEDQIYSTLRDAYVRYEEVNNEKHWKFTWSQKEHVRLTGEIVQHPKSNGSLLLEVDSHGVIAPTGTKEFEAEVAAQLDKTISAIKTMCHLKVTETKKSPK